MSGERESPFASRLRAKAERVIVYPLNRDECLALLDLAEAAEALWNCDSFNLTGVQMDQLYERIEHALAAVDALEARTPAVHP